MTSQRPWLVSGMLGAFWALLVVWQGMEHVSLRKASEKQLIDRAKDISTTCGLLMRARSFFGVISRERLEAALNQLVNPNELQAVTLVNTAGQKVAEAGVPFEIPSREQMRGGVLWGEHNVIVDIPVDLGTNMTADLAPTNMTLVMSSNQITALRTNIPPPVREGPAASNGPPFRRFDLRRERPSFMTEDEYRNLLQQQNVHSFVIVMSDEPVRKAAADDLWLRLVIALLGACCAAGYGLAWRNMTRSGELQLRLVRASEQNLHLKEMNLAAAGLAHETRNPLNIVRGMAQLIAKNPASSPEIREKAADIINQTDRVTGQLNEFINYSRPREVRRAATDLAAVVAEVVRTLAYDIDEKKIQLQTAVEPVIIEADEQLLRQSLFNLALNAIQAVPSGGAILIRASRRNHDEAFLEVSDNGPGVPLENRAEIFKPYFTTNTEGAGLGLSIVQQIVLAHGWEIQCLNNEPKGALFRISHVKLKS